MKSLVTEHPDGIKIHNYQLVSTLFSISSSASLLFKALIRAILLVVVFVLSLMSWKALLQPLITASTTPSSYLSAPLAYFVSFLICCIILFPLVCYCWVAIMWPYFKPL